MIKQASRNSGSQLKVTILSLKYSSKERERQ